MDSPVYPSLSLPLTPHVPQQCRDGGAVQDGQMVRWSDGQMVTSSLSALQLWLLVLARRMRERGGEMPP